ncbi:hypothetical protein CC78DRAFT_615547 [Lojkania enalia]|uniref:Sister chromatid cohesion protein n=1 Tax=Lojkania enalia TaxID=147567 RepID=A0A9P4KD94_9PLEO|nr:hypothetical protein CC78DRAFT_615547 [Didymosphaeria enalia]
MSSTNSNWHMVNGGALPIRPPTVDEALPYSPFTSIVPFMPDIIPYPSAEPPTPPTTLTQDQQVAAKKAIGILNAEIKGQTTSSTGHLQQTLSELQNLLNPEDLTYFEFKSAVQLPTPPPDSPNTTSTLNGIAPSIVPSLTPFAAMLMKKTDVFYQEPGAGSHKQRQQTRVTPNQPAPQPPPPTSFSHSLATVASNTAYSRNAEIQYTAGASSSPGSTNAAPRPGPTVVIKPLPPTTRREEYQRYDNVKISNDASTRKREIARAEHETSAFNMRQREIADEKICELNALIEDLIDTKDDIDGWEKYFTTVTADGSETKILRSAQANKLHEAVMNVLSNGSFCHVPRDDILRIQSLCEPSIDVTTEISLDPTELDLEVWIESLNQADAGLKAVRIVLETMTSGIDDRQICSEDLIGIMVKALKHVLENCVIKVVESRPSEISSDIFSPAKTYRDLVRRVMRSCGRVLKLLADLIGKVTMTEMALSPIEYLALTTMFAQNASHEGESALGIREYESFRQNAIDVLAQIFACHPGQRLSLTNEILQSLDKLSDKRGSARQFKSAREGDIMMVSALFMRIVQAAASRISQSDIKPDDGIKRVQQEDEEYDSGSECEDEPLAKISHSGKLKKRNAKEIANDLNNDASSVALMISRFLITKALEVTKSGDKPFRNLLDLFIEDFCNVLGSPEWPASALLLVLLLSIVMNILRDEKKPVPERHTALNALSLMGVGILEFTDRMEKRKQSLDISQSDLSSKLVHLADDALKHGINDNYLLDFHGPYRVVLDSLHANLSSSRDKLHLQSASGSHVTFWAHSFNMAFRSEQGEGTDRQGIDALEKKLMKMIMEPDWLATEYVPQKVSDSQSQLAASIIALQGTFCKSLPVMVERFISYTRHTSAKLQGQATRSLTNLIDKNPKILSETTFTRIVTMASDNSPSVRETVLNLIAKCLEQNPDWEQHCLDQVLARTTDTSIAPKKRAIKLLKEIYARTESKENQLRIAGKLLIPVRDDEKSIAELARQTLEEMWLPSQAGIVKNDESQVRLARSNRASMLVDIVESIRHETVPLKSFETFFKDVLSPQKSKNAVANLGTCKDLVADMMDAQISGGGNAKGETKVKDPAVQSRQARILRTLAIFAEVKPEIFTSHQMELLKTHVEDFGGLSELPIFGPTVTIFRFVFPILPSLQVPFSVAVFAALKTVLPKLSNWAAQYILGSKETLLDVARCLWTIHPLVQGVPGAAAPNNHSGLQQIFFVFSSCLIKVVTGSASPDTRKTEPVFVKTLRNMLNIVGSFAKVWDFDKHVDLFRTSLQTMAGRAQCLSLQKWNGNSVSALLIDSVLPFTRQAWDISLRKQALCCIGEICQNSPGKYFRNDVEKALKLVFYNQDNVDLKLVVLEQFRDFFSSTERRSESGAEIAVGEGAIRGAERLGNSLVGSDSDGAPLHLAQKFLEDIVKVALGESNKLALLATEIIISISHQGLVHPKKCGPPLVVLGTSPQKEVSRIALIEHQSIHLKNESILEKEYVEAVVQAFKYQYDVFKDPHGMIEKTYKPKMGPFFGILNSGGTPKTRRLFFTNICKRINFDLSRLDGTGAIPDGVLFARFCLENLGLFEFPKVDDILVLTSELEKIVLKQTGPTVALALETEIAKYTPEAGLQQQDPLGENGSINPIYPQPEDDLSMPITNERLRLLTTACMILQMMWETRSFIKRAWNLHGKINKTDRIKPAVRANFVTGKELWERISNIMTALDSRESMMKQCREFAGLLEVDEDAKIDEDLDGNEQFGLADAGYETPDDNGDGPALPNSGRGRKRKSSAALGNTPKKSRGRLASSRNKKRNSKTPDDEEDWD